MTHEELVTNLEAANFWQTAKFRGAAVGYVLDREWWTQRDTAGLREYETDNIAVGMVNPRQTAYVVLRWQKGMYEPDVYTPHYCDTPEETWAAVTALLLTTNSLTP